MAYPDCPSDLLTELVICHDEIGLGMLFTVTNYFFDQGAIKGEPIEGDGHEKSIVSKGKGWGVTEHVVRIDHEQAFVQMDAADKINFNIPFYQ